MSNDKASVIGSGGTGEPPADSAKIEVTLTLKNLDNLRLLGAFPSENTAMCL